MSDRSLFIWGKVKNGVVVPLDDVKLPEGADIALEVLPLGFTPEEAAEYAHWERAGDEAWGSIDWGEGVLARDAG